MDKIYTQNEKSVTVTLGMNRVISPFVMGQTIGIAGEKRLRLKLTNVAENTEDTTLTCKMGYYPSPKSILRKRPKTKFSKIKSRILH